MLKNLFRFEILQELYRNGGNVIYSARDSTNDNHFQIFEWTLPEADFNAAAEEIMSAEADLQQGEVFSAQSSYYLAVQPENSKSNLQLLRAKNLFTGPWANIFPPDSPPTQAPTPPQPVTQSTPPIIVRKASGGWIAATVLFGFAALALTIALISASDDNKSKESQIGRQESQIANLQQQLDQYSTQSSQANNNLANVIAAQRRLGSDASREIDRLFSKAEDLQQRLEPDKYKTVSVKNCTSEDRRLVIRYKSVFDAWVTVGWVGVKPSSEVHLRATDPTFFYHIENGPDYGDIDAEIPDDVPFSHEDGKPVFGPSQTHIKLIRAEGSAGIQCLN